MLLHIINNMAPRTSRRRVHKSKSKRPAKKSRRNRQRTQKGGVCYGRGVGANTYDPNNSIFNTNLLKLFPYRP